MVERPTVTVTVKRSRFHRALYPEWIRLCSLRCTYWFGWGTIVAMVPIAVLLGAMSGRIRSPCFCCSRKDAKRSTGGEILTSADTGGNRARTASTWVTLILLSKRSNL